MLINIILILPNEINYYGFGYTFNRPLALNITIVINQLLNQFKDFPSAYLKITYFMVRNSQRPKRVGLSLFLFALLIVFTCSYTDITNLNCPSGFNLTAANQTLSSTSLAQLFFSVYDSPAYTQRIDNIVITGDKQDLDVLMRQLMLPYIIVAAVFFIMYLIIICCVMFQKSCPPCESWKRDFMKRPYQKAQLRCVLVFTLVFAFIVFVLSIVIFTAIPVFSTQLQYTKCSLYNGLDVTLNGDSVNNWGGFATLKNQVGNISSLLTTASGQVSKYFQGPDGLSDDYWLIDDMKAMLKANLNIYKNNRDSKLITPNKADTQSAITGQNPLPLVDSVFIQTKLGPNGTVGTMVNDLDIALRKTQTLSNQGFVVQKAAKILVDSAVTVQANTQAAQRTLDMYQNSLVSVEAELNQFSGDYFAKLFDWGIYVIQGIVGFTLAASLIIILGVVSTHIFDIFACKSMVNLGWAIYGITYFGVIAMVFVFLSLGSVGYGFCNYYDSMINNQASFNRLGQFYSQNVFTKLDVCLYGDGNVLKKFNLAKQMETVTKVFTQIQTFFDYQDPTSINYVDLQIATNKTQDWIDAIQNYKLGITKDSDDALSTQDNPDFSLEKLNLYTNGDCSRDLWVFDRSACPIFYPSAQVYNTTADVSNGLFITTVDDLCISFNERLSFAQNKSWSQSDFTERYKQIRKDCKDDYDQIFSRGRALINYRDSRVNLFKGITDQLTNLQDLNIQFISDIQEYTGRVQTFYSSVSTLNNLVTDQMNGLLVTSDCRVISKQMKFTYNVLCVNAIPQIAVIGICSVVLLLFMIPAMITSSVFSIRFARIQKSQKLVKRIVIPQTSLHSQTFQKRAQSSDSSSSSDQD